MSDFVCRLIALPIDILDYIVMRTCVNTKIALFMNNTLENLVTPQTYCLIRDNVNNYLAILKQYHKQKLHISLGLLKYHVWSDGTPMKKHRVI